MGYQELKASKIEVEQSILKDLVKSAIDFYQEYLKQAVCKDSSVAHLYDLENIRKIHQLKKNANVKLEEAFKLISGQSLSSIIETTPSIKDENMQYYAHFYESEHEQQVKEQEERIKELEAQVKLLEQN
mmetsp:Transcript_12515/g.12298  ORF Transcript_12515/g.12298 Transcript_12515/m.12298 type:complete len:129 (-) Transcript_12515:109-495(-)